MPAIDPFETECDRLSELVNPMQHEQLRWARNDGPMLARLVALAFETLEDRTEFELTEEGATKDVKRFVLKVHSNRIAAISIRLDGGRAVFAIEPIDRSKYRVSDSSPISIDYDEANEQWVADTLQALFARVQAHSA